MDKAKLREYIRQLILECIEEDSAFASSDSSAVGSGDTSGVSSDPSYVYRKPVGKVQTRPYPSLLGKRKKRKRK